MTTTIRKDSGAANALDKALADFAAVPVTAENEGQMLLEVAAASEAARLEVAEQLIPEIDANLEAAKIALDGLLKGESTERDDTATNEVREQLAELDDVPEEG